MDSKTYTMEDPENVWQLDKHSISLLEVIVNLGMIAILVTWLAKG